MAQPSPFQTILYEKDEGLVWITLNRPHVLNAINLQMRDELWEALLAARDDPEVEVVLLRGAGERAFCAGADIADFGTAHSYVEARRARFQRDIWALMEAFPKPTIACLHGWCLGAGLELPLFCDLRIASEDARLGLPEVNLGYIPSAGGTQTLPRTAPRVSALHMILTGDPIPAREALRLGIVHMVVPRQSLFSQAEALARSLLGKGQALSLLKQALRRGLDMPLPQALAWEERLVLRLLGAHGLQAALARLRAPGQA
jgi:enoyl-CoA hydratase/carnithine racemase